MAWYIPLIPLITVMYAEAGEGMERVFWAATAMLCSTFATGVIIVTGALLPAITPSNGRLRFISDGFEDYRPLPYLSLFLLALQVAIFIWFTRQASAFGPSYAKAGVLHIMQMAGTTSVLGMGMVAVFPEGPVHLFGAGLFIVSYLVMHHVLGRILVQTNLLLEKQVRGDEWFVLGGAGFFLLFGGLLAAGMTMKGDAATTLESVSAVAEYAVFAVFIVLNFNGMDMMTYICVDRYEGKMKVGGVIVDGGKKKWVKKKEEDTIEQSYMLIPPPNIRLHHPDPNRPVVMRIPSTWT